MIEYLINPAALRAIPATVPPAFCVLRSVLWGRPGNREKAQRKKRQISQNRSKNRPKIDQKSSKIDPKSSKIEVWRGPGGSWGPQGCPKGARNQKSDEKFAQPPFVPQSLGSQKSSIFDIFAIFVDFFCGRFSEARFGGLRPQILEDFGMFF